LEKKHSAYAPLTIPDFRYLFVGTACATLASRALAVVLGYQVFDITGSKLALGMLGLVEAIPAVGLVLIGGHVADRRDRRIVLRATLLGLSICAFAIAAISLKYVVVPGTIDYQQLGILYTVVFIAGIARGFAEPAAAALEAQVVPTHLLVSSSTLMATCWLTTAVVGPMLGGLALATIGPAYTFGCISAVYLFAFCGVMMISPKPIPAAPPGESIWESVSIGVKYVLSDQVLVGSMALDLFAVLFGGAIALLPVFAKDILRVGPVELGALNAAPTAGALLTMLWATHRPPVRNAGRNLLVAVAGFGVAMIVFALSTSFWLSMVAIFMSGVFDGISVVIRRSILRLMSPDHLRGRIAAVSMVFIGSSNELGALESGLAAQALGTQRSVWLGGIVTLIVVSGAAVFAPKLRQLHLDPSLALKKDAEVDEKLDAGEE
jgi:MFS family permease